jgi:phospholipid-transporting ATPase
VEDSTSVIALVVHTGDQTKISMNMGTYHFKMSRFEKILNGILIFNLILGPLVLNIINVLQWKSWTANSFNNTVKPNKKGYLWYKILVDGKMPKIKLMLQNFMTVYLIVNQFVPLDLLVAIEIAKLVYTNLMQDDAEMKVADYDMRDVNGFRANHLGLHEELSLVDYVFCDKTGTLTKNQMVFRAICTADGKGFYFNETTPVTVMKKDWFSSLPASGMNQVLDLFRCIGICHDCIATKHKKKDDWLVYNGPSVDEVALHDMA